MRGRLAPPSCTAGRVHGMLVESWVHGSVLWKVTKLLPASFSLRRQSTQEVPSDITC